MRFMMVVIRKGYETAAADAAPGAEAVAGMMEYNNSLQKAERSRAESSRRLRGAFERGCGKGVSDIQA